MKAFLTALLLAVSALMLGAEQTPSNKFEAANEAFYAGEHEKALALYSDLDTVSPALLYNQARTLAALNRPGEAILLL